MAIEGEKCDLPNNKHCDDWTCDYDNCEEKLCRICTNPKYMGDYYCEKHTALMDNN
jgi:hypothetical protein